MFGRGRFAAAAKDIADHLRIVDHIAELQKAQREFSMSLSRVEDSLLAIETDIKVMRAEVKVDALKEAQSIVNSTLGSVSQRLEHLAVEMALLAHHTSSGEQFDRRTS